MSTTSSLVPCASLKRGHQPRNKEDEAAQVARLRGYFLAGEVQLVPIITHKGSIVDGHCRWEAMKGCGGKVWSVEWHGDKPPTMEEVRRINSTQAAIPAIVKVERVRRRIAKGDTLEQIAKEDGTSPEKLKRKLANVEKVEKAGTVDLASASQAAIDKEAARLTKEADKAKAGTVDKRGRIREGTASEARAEVAKACQSDGGGVGLAKGETVDQVAPECPGCAALLARLEKVKESRASVRQELAEALARVDVLEAGEVGKLRAQVEALRGARDKWKEKAEALEREKRCAMGED